MKTILFVLLAWLIASVLGFVMGWMYVRHGIAFTYLLCAVIGGGFLTYWSNSDEHSHVSRPDRG